MYPKHHILYGAIFSLLLLIFIPKINLTGAIIIFLASVLIDVDHYLAYGLTKKDWNLKNAFNWFHEAGLKIRKLPTKQQKKIFIAICAFHGIEILLILLALSLFHPFFLLILIGFSFHMFLDLLYEVYYDERFHKMVLILDILASKRLKHVDNL